MKTVLKKSIRWIAGVAFLCLLALSFSPPAARAGLTFELKIFQYGSQNNYTYYFDPQLATNSVGANVSFGNYALTSFGIPTNGSSSFWQYDSSGFNQTGGDRNSYGDFNTMAHEITNGVWSLFVTNATITNIYYFRVALNISSNGLPKVLITAPLDGAVNVTNQPVFTWQGPGNYSSLAVSEFNLNQSLPASQTSWLSTRMLYQGPNSFNVEYMSNSTTAAVASVPTNSLAQPFSGWVSTDVLDVSYSCQFSVGLPDTSGGVYALVAHYPFDATNGPVSSAALDSSGNGFNMSTGGTFGSQGGDSLTSDSAAGTGAVLFQDGDSQSGAYLGWTDPTPPALLSALAGSFSVSCWIKTTQNIAWNTAPAYVGAGIVSADNFGQANDVIPIALTGGSIAFNTGGAEDVTLNSVASVNDGNYHHIVVTRNQATGQKIIYIDGQFDGFASGTTNLLNDSQKLTIGALANAGNPDPNDGSYYQGFDGELDDLQIYSGVLSGSQVAQLFANPGITVNQIISQPLVARYNFEDPDSSGIDSSGNGNDANCGTGNGGPNVDIASTDAAVGHLAREYFGDTGICFDPNGAACFNNLSNAMYGSFSWTAWVNTTNSASDDDADALFGSPIWFESSDPVNQAVFSITGSKAAFSVGNPNSGADTTLHSTTTVNDGAYHFIAATRNVDSGLMSLYVDGHLEATGVSTSGPRTASSTIFLAGGNYGFFYGLLDDVRVYGGELSASDVAALSGHPLTDFNPALNTTGLPWATGGDSIWFVETTNTEDGVSAAQSGSVIGNQSSTLSVTVTGPGILNFYWASHDDCNNFDFEFDVDGNYTNDISCSQSWIQAGPYAIPAGSHTLSWTAYANGDTDPTQAGFLDSVSYVPVRGPIITLNPFNQTNYPGYSVALLAAATSNAAITWQWFKVGAASPIPNATSALFIPTNSGTAGVQGSYYAVATDNIGSANTTTALVSFVSAPLPPDWSHATNSPFHAEFDTNVIKDYYGGCAADSAGNIYVADQYVGDVIVRSNFITLNTLTAVGTNGGAALIKHAADGTPLWGVGLTNNQPSSHSYANSVALAPGNGAYLASILIGTNWLGTNQYANNGGLSVLLSRFDANGNNVWSRLIGQTGQVFGTYNALVSDAAGNLTVAGVLNGTADFGGTNLTSSGYMGFLAQYNANGGLLWAQILPGTPQNLAYGAGRIYLALSAVNSGGTTNLNLGGLSNLTDRAYGLAAVNATNGQALWLRGGGELYGARTNGGFPDDVPLVSVSGPDVFVTGTAYGSTALFGGLSVPLPGGRYQYFARYDTNGNPQVATSFGSTTTMPWASAANSSGVYISGDFDNYSQFGNDIVAAPVVAPSYLGPYYFTQPFVAKFDRDGNPLWARNGMGSALANFRGIATTSDGVWASGIVLLNDTFHPAQFGTHTIISDGYIDDFGTGIIFLFTQGGFLAKITESSPATSVTLINPHPVGANFQFQFLSESGFSHNILYRTNLATGNWQTNSTVSGDGTVKTISLPFSLFSPAKQGFIRVSTQ
jgi:hypothetical protein